MSTRRGPMTGVIAATLAMGALSAAPAIAGRSEKAVVASRLKLVSVKPTRVVQAGTFTSKRLGDGRMRATSTRKGSSTTFRTTTVLTLGGGTIRLAGVNDVTNRDPETLTVRGSARIVSGTGKYRHARGAFRVAGTGPQSLAWLALTLTGTVVRG